MNYIKLKKLLPVEEIHHIDDCEVFFNENPKLYDSYLEDYQYILFEYTISCFSEVIKTLKENNVSSDDYTQWTIDHSIPLLQDQRLLNLDFKIIDFYKLNKYIGFSKVTVITNSVKPGAWLCSKSIYDDYMMLYHSQEEMEREYQAYRSIMISHDEISVPEWKLMVDFLDKK